MVWHPCRHRCCTHKTPAIVCVCVCVLFMSVCVCVCTLCVHHMCQYPYFRMHNYNVYRSSAIYDVTVTTFKGYRSHNSSTFTFFSFFLFFFDTLADFLFSRSHSRWPKLVLVSASYFGVRAVNTAIIRWYNLCSRSPLCVCVCNCFHPPPPLCNAWFTNKGTTKKIELCRQTERNREGGGQRERERGHTSVTNLTLQTISSI